MTASQDLFKLDGPQGHAYTNWMETMSGVPQRKLRLYVAPSPPRCEPNQIGDPSKDRWRNLMFPLDI
jgi:hypothetical protein